MYKNCISVPVKKKKKKRKKETRIFTRINKIHPTVAYNTHRKFELNLMHPLDAIVFNRINTCTHTYKYSINDFKRPQNV